jgi:hypothetical protein
VSYGIVREHGGDIEVASELGAGTRFALSFPEAQAGKVERPVKRTEPIPTEPVVAAMCAPLTSAHTSTHTTHAPTQMTSPAQASAPAIGVVANSDRMIR